MLDVVAHALHRPHVARMRTRAGRTLRPIRPSRQAELWYLNRLTDLLDQLRAAARRHLLEALRPLGVRDADPWRAALDALARDKAFMSLKGQAQELARLAARKALYWTDDRLGKEIQRSLGVDVRAVLGEHGAVADRMKDFTRWNVDLISTLPDRFKADLEAKLGDAWASGLRVKAIEGFVDDVVAEAGDAADANAALIARDQMGKMNAAFNQVRQSELGITQYRWRSSDDERVRPDHVALDGQVFSWDEPGPLIGEFGDPCHPGEDIQCRCSAEPYFNLDQMEKETFA